MSDLTTKKCIPCEGKGIKPMSLEDAEKLVVEVVGWHLHGSTKIIREFLFSDFAQAIAFVNKVAVIAESEGHHPNITIHYNKVILELYTHSIGGLHENDFILAAKINQL